MMELKKVTKREARKAFDAKQTLIIVTVDSVGIEQDRLVLNDFEYNNKQGLVGAYNYDFDTVLEHYSGYSFYNRYTRVTKWVHGRKIYYKAVE